MAGSFKNLRPTSESHLFQQTLRKDVDLARRARRERDPMALQASRAAAAGVQTVPMMAAVLRGYDPTKRPARFSEIAEDFFILDHNLEPILDHNYAALLSENM